MGGSNPQKETVEETHISRVIIGPRYTYKIKKPVNFHFVDYSTPAKRKHFCKEEVKLNRRYSPKMYLGVARLENGEYAVKMKTMPAEKRLDRLLDKNQVTPQMMALLAKVVWAFHQRARVARGPFGSPQVLRQAFTNDFRNVKKFIGRYINRDFCFSFCGGGNRR